MVTVGLIEAIEEVIQIHKFCDSMDQLIPLTFRRLGLYSYTCSFRTPCHTGKTSCCASKISRVNIESNSFFVHPPFVKKFGLKTSTHFLHSFCPFSMLSRKLSPTLSANSSYHTGHIRRWSPIAILCATSLSRESYDMNAKGTSCFERAITYSADRN
jgi:hypothetical protein